MLSHPGFLLQRTIEDLNGIWFLYLLKFCSFSNCQHHAFLCALGLLRPWLMRSTSCWKTLLLCQSSRKRSHPRSQKVHRNCSMDLQCDEHWVFCSWILKNSGKHNYNMVPQSSTCFLSQSQTISSSRERIWAPLLLKRVSFLLDCQTDRPFCRSQVFER